MSANSPESQDRQEAAKMLVEFVAKYSLLLEDLLESVRKDMADTVDQVMIQLDKVNRASTEQKLKAHEVIIGNEKKHIEGDAKKANEAQIEGILTQPSKEAKDNFISKMNSLDNMDKRLQKLMMTMMGALSADDVVGHRISHTKKAIALLGEGLGKVVDKIDVSFTKAEVAELNREICKKVYNGYSMEEEREFFHKIFGKASE